MALGESSGSMTSTAAPAHTPARYAVSHGYEFFPATAITDADMERKRLPNAVTSLTSCCAVYSVTSPLS